MRRKGSLFFHSHSMTDKVVQSGNVYMSTDLDDTLHLLQFTHFNKFTMAKLKKQQMKLHLSFRYENEFISLESTQKPMNARYCAGTFDEHGDLVLHELETVMELAPKVHIAPTETTLEEVKEFKSIHLQNPQVTEDFVDLNIINARLELGYVDEELPFTSNYLDKVLGTTAFKEVDVNERIHQLFTNAHVLFFDTQFGTESWTLSVYKHFAYCIRGVWVVKSEFLYTGRPLHARNYLLSLFAENEFIDRFEFSETCRLPHEISFRMLQEIAVLENSRWCLKLSCDEEFTSNNKKLIEENIDQLRELGKAYVMLI
jgi:hypothetical protein